MRNILILFISIISFLACNGSVKGDSKKQIANDITILRFDKDLRNYLQNPILENKNNLIKKYPSLLPAFGQITVGKMIENDTIKFFDALSGYFAHPVLERIYEDEIQKFSDISSFENILSDAYTSVREIFPEKRFPKFAIHMSGFKENVIVVDGIISLSADKYLGRDYPLYEQYFSPTERSQMNPAMMPRDYLKAWIITENIVKTDKKLNLLTSIIEEGKALYFLDKIASTYKSEELIGYTQEQMIWCETNIKYIWKETQKSNRLLSADKQLISRYVEEAPVSKNILPDAPDRVGCWLGWKIVEEYASQTGKSVQEVLVADAQTILKQSKFKP